MYNILAVNWKKKILFGVGLLLFISATIVAVTYATFRADANQSSIRMSVPEESNTRVDIKVDNEPEEPNKVAESMESGNSAARGAQQSKAPTSNPNVDVHVNGAPIDVPENGSVHKEIVTQNGSASINVSSQSSSISASNSNTRSSINVGVDSSVRVQSNTGE